MKALKNQRCRRDILVPTKKVEVVLIAICTCFVEKKSLWQFISFLVLIVTILNCTSKAIKPVILNDISPQEIPKFALTQLKNQKSFRFELHFKTDTPSPIAAEFSGLVVQPNQEERTGIWNRLGEKVKSHIKGVGNFQYERKDNKWEIHPRGEESNILIEIERILFFSEFSLQAKTARQIVFQFKPNLVFLDPTRSKLMTGVLYLNSSSLLPEKIQVSDSARTAFWEIRFYDYNRKGKLVQPFIPKIRIQLAAEFKIDTKVKNQLIDRFQSATGGQTKIKTLGNNIELQLEQEITEAQINLLIGQGKVEIYSGEWLESKIPTSDTGLIKYFQSKSVRLNQLFLTNQMVERAEANLNQGPEPMLELFVKAQNQLRLEGQGKLLFLLFDDEIIGYTQIGQNQPIEKLQFKAMGDVVKIKTVAAIINAGMIKPKLKFIAKQEI